MYIALDAVANDDDTKFSYMFIPYDEELLDAIVENLREIKIKDELSFPIEDALFVRGEYHYVRKKLTMTDIANQRFSIGQNIDTIPKLENPKVHIANDYFYFSGYKNQGTKNNQKLVRFVSDNFNVVTIENMKKFVKKKISPD
jgi:hypothetical protein